MRAIIPLLWGALACFGQIRIPGPGGSAPVVSSGISYINSCTGTTSCGAVPTHQSGDLFIAYVGRDASTTAPTLPSGWTSVTTPSINGTSTADSVALMACKVAAGSSETVTGFTNGANLVVHIYRNTKAPVTNCADVLGTPSNFTSTINTTTTTVTYNSITNAGPSSWTAGFAYAPAATAGLGTAPTAMTNRSSTGSTKAAGHDTNGGVSSWSTANVTVTTAGRVITTTVEIKAQVAATPTDSPGAGSYGSAQTVTLTSSTSGATICYTTDGSSPAASTPGTCSAGTTYTGGFSVSSTSTVKALATKAGMNNSSILSSTYTIGSGPAAGGSCAGNGFGTPQSCTISGGSQSIGTYIAVYASVTDAASAITITATCNGSAETFVSDIAQGSTASLMGHFVVGHTGTCIIQGTYSGGASGSLNVGGLAITGTSGVDVAATTINHQACCGGTGTDQAVSNSVTTTQANDLCVGASADISATDGTVAAGTGWTLASKTVTSSGGSYPLIVESKAQASTGSVQALFSFGNSFPTIESGIACYKP